uniref:CG12250-like protein n=1 Tax=Drosophila buzzatii TaxID=7264 RepID=I3RSD5_DROBU|nr:CG12250-like protein [Drosophila buzzatii]
MALRLASANAPLRGLLNTLPKAIPIVIITALGLAIEFLVIMRLAATRDDLWYTNGSAACDYIETRKGYKVPIRKLMVFNQKYENPPGLIAAIQGDVDGPEFCKYEKIRKKYSASSIAQQENENWEYYSWGHSYVLAKCTSKNNAFSSSSNNNSNNYDN